MFDALDIGATGLTVQRARMDVIAGNIANATTTHDAAGKPNPYRRRFAVIAAGAPDNPSKPGVHVQTIRQDASPFLRRYEPWNKDAGQDGYVDYPNVDPTVEFVNAIEASRAYEANVTMMDVTKAMLNASLRLLG
jgi:flagellar basal-body rod protein FlgC